MRETESLDRGRVPPSLLDAGAAAPSGEDVRPVPVSEPAGEARASLLDAVRTALAETRGVTQVPPQLATQFRAYVEAGRARSLRAWLVSLLALQPVFFLCDWVACPDAALGLALSRLVGAPLAFAGLLWLGARARRLRSGVWACSVGAIALGSALVVLGGVVGAVLSCDAGHTDRALIAGLCICFFGSVIVRLTFREMVAYAVTVMAAFTAMLLTLEPLGLAKQLDVLLFAVATLAFSGVLRRGADRSRMRGFLRHERDALLAEELARTNAELAAVNARLADANERLRHLSTTDALTGLANRRHFDAALEAAWRRAAYEATAIAVLMIDVDHFKRLNDAHGHDHGDAALRAIAEALLTQTRQASDLVARYGGEEFVVLMQGADGPGARRAGERVCEGVRALRLPHALESGPAGVVTVSVGAAACIPPIGGAAFALVQAADAALYQAKRTGRDRVVLAPPSPDLCACDSCQNRIVPDAEAGAAA
jgi:diguanylate cyclase (GGDEF)-like protein